MKVLLIMTLIALGFRATAASLEFTMETTVSQCPPGAEYPVFECTTLSDVSAVVHIDMKDYGNHHYQSSWSYNQDSASFEITTSAFTNVYTGRTLSIIVDAGYDTKAHFSLEWDPAHPPYGVLLNGSRKTQGPYEIVPEMKMSAIKYVE
jgi:hypothetical protein